MANRFWVGGGSSSAWNATGNTNWSTTSGGANNASVPGSADAAIFNAAAAAASQLTAALTVQSLTCTGYSGIFTHDAGVTLTVGAAGAVVFAAGMTVVIGDPDTSVLAMGGALTSAGKTLGRVAVNQSTTLTLQDDLVCGTLLNTGFGAATITANTHNVTVSGSVACAFGRTLNLGTGIWTVGGWFATGATISASTSLIVLNAAAPSPVFAGDQVYHDLLITGTGTDPIQITGGPTFANTTIEAPPKEIQVESGSTWTAGNLIAQGADGALITLRATTPGSAWNLAVTTSFVAYCAVQDSQASGGGAPIDDLTGGVDNGGNTNWLFPPSSGYSGGSTDIGGKPTFPGPGVATL